MTEQKLVDNIIDDFLDKKISIPIGKYSIEAVKKILKDFYITPRRKKKKSSDKILEELNLIVLDEDLLTNLIINDEPKKTIIEGNLKITNFIDNVESFWNIQPFFYDKACIWWWWNKDEFKYEMVDEVDLMNSIDSALGFGGETVSGGLKSSYLEAFKRVGRKHIPLESPKRWIQFKDKAFSLRSKKIHDIQSNYFFTNPIPWKLNDSENTPILDKLFLEWVGEKYIKTLYEIIAYCCYTDYPIQVLFCLYGGGRNGKSCFLKVLAKFLGKKNLCSTDLDLLIGHNKSRFEIFKLYKKLACLLGETNFGVLENSAILKKLTGSDLIGFEVKGKLPFDDYNYAKILIASNTLPSSEDTSEGFYRRWVIIDFPNQFKEGKDITETIPDQEYECLARKICRIIPELLENGSFTNQGTIEQRKEKYIMASNPLSIFINGFCIHGVENYVRYSALYTAYIKFLSQNNRRIVSKKEFTKRLNEEGLENRKTSKEGIIDYYIEGIKFKELLPDFLDFQNSELSNAYRESKRKTSEIKEIKEIFENNQEISTNWLVFYFGKEKEKEVIESLQFLAKKGDIVEIRPDTWKKL